MKEKIVLSKYDVSMAFIHESISDTYVQERGNASVEFGTLDEVKDFFIIQVEKHIFPFEESARHKVLNGKKSFSRQEYYVAKSRLDSRRSILTEKNLVWKFIITNYEKYYLKEELHKIKRNLAVSIRRYRVKKNGKYSESSQICKTQNELQQEAVKKSLKKRVQLQKQIKETETFKHSNYTHKVNMCGMSRRQINASLKRFSSKTDTKIIPIKFEKYNEYEMMLVSDGKSSLNVFLNEIVNIYELERTYPTLSIVRKDKGQIIIQYKRNQWRIKTVA